MSRFTFWSGGLAVMGLALTGCTSSSATSATSASPVASAAAGAVFHLPDNFQPNSGSAPCLLHQTDAPTAAFMGGPSASPAFQLPFMAYLRANGNKAFCDGAPATDVDKKWAALYITLTNNAADVAGITK